MTEKEKLALAEKVCQIAEDASALMKHRPSEEEITQKGNISNYVTATDVAVQHYLEEKLTALIEGSEVLGEESEECVPEAEAVWIVDPIDGTSNFIRDLGASVISIALMHLLFHPLLILAVTGRSTVSTTALTMSLILSGSFRSALPACALTATFVTGHPMFMSIMSGFMFSSMYAAAILKDSAPDPKICWEIGLSASVM